MIDFLTALWPLFALIVTGAVMKACRFPDDGFWAGADSLNYRVLFPALLFANLSTAPFNDPALPRLLAAVVLTLGVGAAGLWVARHRQGWKAARFGVWVQGCLRFNTYLGLATVGSLYGQEGLRLAAVVLGVLVPLVNVLSVVALSMDNQLSLRRLMRPLLTNPLILACLAGALVNFSGIELRFGADRLVSLTAAASLPLGLLCVGAALKPRELTHELAPLCANSALRLLLLPTLAFLAAWLVHLPLMECTIVVLFFALPTAATAYALTRTMNGDSQLMAGLITLQTLLSAVSLPLVLSLVGLLST